LNGNLSLSKGILGGLVIKVTTKVELQDDKGNQLGFHHAALISCKFKGYNIWGLCS